LNIERNVEPDGPGAPAQHFKESTLQVVADHCRIVEGDGVFGNGAHHGHDVDFLHTALAEGAAVESIGTFDLAGNEE